MAENESWLARKRDARRAKKALKGDSPERLAEHHEPKRDIIDKVVHSSPGGQRHSSMKGDRR